MQSIIGVSLLQTKLRSALWRACRGLALHRLLRLAANPSVPALLGDARVEAASRWIENHIMVRRRQRRCGAQRLDMETAAWLRSHFCPNPFTTLETTHTGLAFVCCPVWLPIVRRGGNFERLLKNLAFIKGLRQSGEISALEFSMVVQSQNFREMPEFVHLGRAFAADTTSFQMIRKRDIFSGDEFESAFIGNPAHKDYPAFLDILKAPDLSLPGVQMGNILAYVHRSRHTLSA
jgi:hypothetical protein